MNARLVITSCAALLLAACGETSSRRPDAGGVAVCDPNEERFLVVTVQTAAGEPAADATVTARNSGTGKTVTALTNAQGVTSAIGTSLGSGSVVVSAQQGNKVSNTAQADFSCGECGCLIQPDSLTLKLSP